MEAGAIELQGITEIPGCNALRMFAFSAKRAWDNRDYRTLARINRAMFDIRPEGVSRQEVSKMLTEAGCPINYVPVA